MNCKMCKNPACAQRGIDFQKERCDGFVPKTNADRIRAMSDEELAEFFPTTASEFSCPPNSTNESCQNAGGWFDGCPRCWLDWLKQEAKDGEEEKEENQSAK